MKTLYLIDGYAQFFRAYHAIRTPMTSPVTKEPTNMTYGFVGMLLKLLRGEGQIGGPPDFVAVALDVSGDRGTFRTQLYPNYKATRPPPPEDLFPQIERAVALLKEVGVPVLGAEGFEADDVIATLVTQLRAQNPDLRIRIISKDKDLKQLLEPGWVELYDIHHDTVIDVAALHAETGLRPDQVIDLLALMGDTSDNVPGVDGIGLKTAAQLLVEFGSLDAVVAEAIADKPKKDWLIKGKRRERIIEATGHLDLSRQLVTLRHDVPIALDLELARADALEMKRLGPILRELGFNRYQQDLRALMGAPDPATPSTAPASSNLPPAGGLFDQVHAAAPRTTDANYRCITTEAQLDELVAELRGAGRFAIDTETTSIRAMRADLCGISVSIAPKTGAYIPVRSPDPSAHLDAKTVLRALGPLIEDPAIAKLGHNLKYDLLVFRRAGVELRGFSHPDACDTMIASYLIDSSRSSHSLDALALALLDHTTIPISELIGTGKQQRKFDEVPIDQASDYAAEDADITLRLAELMMPQLRAMGLSQLATDLEMPLVPVLAELQWNGIAVDPDELDLQRERLGLRIEELRDEIRTQAIEAVDRSFDPDSPKQLAGVLFNKPDDDLVGLGLRVIKRRKTGPSTDAEVLDKLAGDPGISTPIPRLMLEYRQLTKLVNTYLLSLKDEINPTTGRIHASFNQTVAATGRLSSSEPNLQNIPIRTDIGREIRRAFIAPPGRVLVSADYSQIELRLLAHLSRDPALIEAFRRGEDIHTAVAAQIHGIPIEEVTREQRSGAKMVNFGIVYGVTPFGLARRLDIGTKEAAIIIDDYKTRFSGITTFLQECVDQAKRFGHVETMMARRRPIPDIASKNPPRRAMAERMAINSVVQGSAADLIKIAMVDLHARLSPHASHLRQGKPAEIPDTLMLLQIHDELVFEVDEANAERARVLIVDRMESAMELRVPICVDSAISGNWFEGK